MVGLGWWGQNIVRDLTGNAHVTEVRGYPTAQARAIARGPGRPACLQRETSQHERRRGGTGDRGGKPVTEFFPPHPSVRENLEQFARAALGRATYPVSLDEMLANVHTFGAITRSAASGRVEAVAHPTEV